ncbi:MAG: FlaA1/EpsC-like NDP-sugar epimerase [Arcticibacterium sp.]|jgi:FlaA1/EpsC-like NDP-sugar epimerase
MHFLDLDRFISKHITNRDDSLFLKDLDDNYHTLYERIEDTKVLVIGGAGTIGSSFIRAILRYKPASLFVVDLSENGLTELTRDLRSDSSIVVPNEYRTYPLSFSDPIFYKILDECGPFDIVANFAAHKHVRSEKDHYSIGALLNNNVIQAQTLLERLRKNPPKHFFCVSTDKAANPVNIMGASKKLMEDIIMSYSSEIPITTARFANVAFSNGSLLSGFLSRMLKKQPISAPSDVRRYFVSPNESGEICLLACILGKSREVFFPKLEESQMTTFSAIANSFLNECGYQSHLCETEEEAKEMASNWTPESTFYPVYYFESDTSGEKIFEEFFTLEESVDLHTFKGLGVVKDLPKVSESLIKSMIDDLKQVIDLEGGSKEVIVEILNKYIPNFNHLETGKNLDQKM